MEQSNQNKLLGEEKISKLLLKFSIPCIMSLLISALYNIVDQIFIGNSELGYLGNAATGIVFPILIIAQAFAWCIGDGCAAYLSICQGKIISFVYFFRTKTFRLKRQSFVPDMEIFNNARKLGISSFITQISIVAISLVCNMMLYKYGEMSKYGSDIPILVISIETKIFTIIINIVVFRRLFLNYARR